MSHFVSLYDKYLGCIVGAAAGDALGAATETLSTNQIENIYKGRVTDFCVPSAGTLAHGRQSGQVTDAFSIPYVLWLNLLKNKGKASREIGENTLREWGASEWFAPFAGMTTRNAVNRLNKESKQGIWEFAGHLNNKLFKGHYYALSSNGAAVKAWPAALLHPSKVDAAIADTVELTMASHDDPLSISGACAVSAAVSTALGKEIKLYDIIEAAFYGAKRGEELARTRQDVWVYPGPSVSARLEMATETALLHSDNGMNALRDLIGSGPAIAETVPTAFGLLISRGGCAQEALLDGVNIGDETSAIASIIGAVGGAWQGISVFPEHYLSKLEQANKFNLTALAGQIMQVVGNF
jgi:ADP-ribosylglycohydrolase